MDHSLTTEGSISISASPQRVWDVLTKPALIKIYLYGSECITDWKLGSDIIFQGEYEGQKYKDKGIVQEVTCCELLSYKYWSGFSGLADIPDNYSLVKYLLLKLDDTNTQLTWKQFGFPDDAKRKHSEEGIPTLLEDIKKVAESNS